MFIKLKDKSKKEVSIELDKATTALTLAHKLHTKEVLAVEINGKIKDLSSPLYDGDIVCFLFFEDSEGKEVFWHTSAHVLAQAILRLWPQALLTIGPPIENGFYYDVANLKISEEDFSKIEEEMEHVSRENWKPERIIFSSKKEAIHTFKNNPYKVELIENLPEGEEISAYKQGEFIDLCRGPHLPELGKIKAIKITKTSGAYWHADPSKEMLTRIYGITFPEKHLLKEYLHVLEEAKKRDHKLLGPKLGIFSLQEEAPGMPFIHPKGMIIWNVLLDFLHTLCAKHNYVEIKTPSMMTRDLWERSGHWDNYRDHMFTSSIENRDFAIKPMNCPGCILFYKTQTRSYREFPLRIAEIGHVHRFEPSGSLSGLFRVRSFHQDDAHIFMLPEQIEEEIADTLRFADTLYAAFGLEYRLELSTKPQKNTIGSDSDWEFTTEALKNALDFSQKPYKINFGDGAFYGPKIDFHIRDALKRSWQCGTIQLDMNLPERFHLEYSAHDGTRKRPVMIHRAIFGSLERFLGILIEQFAGKFPLWLSPLQIRLIPVSERHLPYAKKLISSFSTEGFHADVDTSDESFSKKIRNAQVEKINYMGIIGDKEIEQNTLSLRSRTGGQIASISLQNLLEKMHTEKGSRSLLSFL